MFQKDAHQRVATTDSITEDALAGEVSAFSSVTYLDDVQLSDGLQSGSISAAVVFACSDMGLQLPYVCSSPAARVFVYQKFGHCLIDGEVPELTLHADVSDVIVYGHSHCELVKFLARSEHNPEEEAIISRYFGDEHAAQIKNYAGSLATGDREQWLKISRTNVLTGLKVMLLNPYIADQISRHKLRLHGWLYDSQQMVLEIFDPEKNRFLPPR